VTPSPQRRKNLRLPDFDYAMPGAYFVTTCAQDRRLLFDPAPIREMIQAWWDRLPWKFPNVETDEFVIMPNHIHGIIVLTDTAGPSGGHAGPPLPDPADAVQADPCVGPDIPHPTGGHIGPPLLGHAGDVQADPCVGPNAAHPPGGHAGPPLPGHAGDVRADPCVGPNAAHPPGGHAGPPLPGNAAEGVRGDPRVAPLPRLIQWFKTMTTNEYIRGVKNLGWTPFPGRLWQRNYYEHVIRDDDEWNATRNYIRENPAQWESDRENPTSPAAGKDGFFEERLQSGIPT
jgi:putative transposase